MRLAIVWLGKVTGRFFKVRPWWPPRHFERPQIFYLIIKTVVKQVLVYFGGGRNSQSEVLLYFERPLEKFERPFRSLKMPEKHWTGGHRKITVIFHKVIWGVLPSMCDNRQKRLTMDLRDRAIRRKRHCETINWFDERKERSFYATNTSFWNTNQVTVKFSTFTTCNPHRAKIFSITSHYLGSVVMSIHSFSIPVHVTHRSIRELYNHKHLVDVIHFANEVNKSVTFTERC